MQAKVRAMKSIADVEVDLKATEGGDLHTIDMPRIWTSKGYGWQATTTVGVAALVVRPSTVPLLTIYNGEAGGGKVYIVERVFCFNLVSTAAAAYWSIWGCVHPVGTTASASVITAAMIRSTRGISAYGGNAKIDDDTACLDDGWFPLGDQGASEATGVLPSGCKVTDIGGRLQIPPTAALSLSVVSSAIGQTFTVGLMWYEVPQTELGIA